MRALPCRSLLTSIAIAFLVAPMSAQVGEVRPTRVIVLALPSTGDVQSAEAIASADTVIATRHPDGTYTPAATCDQPPHPTVIVSTNPTRAAIDDPYHEGRDCVVSVPQGLPAGTYRLAALFSADECLLPGAPALTRPCLTGRSPSTPATVTVGVQAPSCGPDAVGRLPVRIFVFGWTARVLPTGTVTIRYSAADSRDPVTAVHIDPVGPGAPGVVLGGGESADVRPATAVTIAAPLAAGDYRVQLTARTAEGCTAQSAPLRYQVRP